MSCRSTHPNYLFRQYRRKRSGTTLYSLVRNLNHDAWSNVNPACAATVLHRNTSRSFIHQLPTLPVSCPRFRLCRFRSIHSSCLREPPPSSRPRRLRLFGTSLKLVNLVFSITQLSYFHLSALSILFQLHSRGEDFSPCQKNDQTLSE